MSLARSFSAVIFAGSLLAAPLSAQQTTKSQNDPRPVAHAAVRAGDVTIDGKLNESAGQPRRRSPSSPVDARRRQGAERAHRAARPVRRSSIYVGARMFDSQGKTGVRAVLVRRDQLLTRQLTSDKIALVLDPYHDRNTRMWFELNPLGVKGDHLNGDASFDPVWEGAAHDRLARLDGGVPHSAVAAPLLARLGADLGDAGLAHDRSPERAGHVGVLAQQRERRARLLRHARRHDAQLRAAAAGAGAVRDVESDARRARIRRSVSRQPRDAVSRRCGPQGQHHVEPHARRDGEPRLRPGGGRSGRREPLGLRDDLLRRSVRSSSRTRSISRPAASTAFSAATSRASTCSTRVASAARRSSAASSAHARRTSTSPTPRRSSARRKITGRTKGGLTVGLLDAVTNREDAKFRLSADGEDHAQEVEPLTNYFVGRVRKDYRGGATRIGAITTLVNRSLSNDDEVARLRRRAGASASTSITIGRTASMRSTFRPR